MNALKKTFSQADKLLSGGKSSAYGSNMTFVHGQLIVDVIGARDLPDLEGKKNCDFIIYIPISTHNFSKRCRKSRTKSCVL